MATRQSLTFTKDGQPQQIDVFVGADTDIRGVMPNAFSAIVKISAAKLTDLVAILGNVKILKTAGDAFVPGQITIPDIADTAGLTPQRVAFVNTFTTAVNGIAAPHSLMSFRQLLQIPAAMQFREAAGTDVAAQERHGAAYLLGVAVGTIYINNLRLCDVVSERTYKQYESLVGGSRPEKYSSQIAAVNAALSKKSGRDGLTDGQSKFGAALHAMLTWVQVALLSSPEVTVNLAARLTPFIESFAQASSSQGLTQITQIYCNLREASWLTEDEIAKWAALEDFGASIGSTELVGSPLSQVLTAIEFREL